MEKIRVEGILLGLCLFVGISFGMDMDDYLVTGSTTPRGCCEDGWIGYRGSCYHGCFCQLSLLQLRRSYEVLLLDQVNLVEIDADWENSFLKEYSRHFSKAGGSDAGHSESWTWENSQTALTFTDWALGQPMRNTGHCLKMAGFWNYSWQVGDCSKKEFFICERNLF